MGQYAKLNKPDTKRQILYDSTYADLYRERWLGARGRGVGWECGVIVLWVQSFCLGMMKKILEKDSGDARTTFSMYLMPMNTLRSIKMVHFVMAILPVYKAYHDSVCMCVFCIFRVKTVFLPQS